MGQFDRDTPAGSLPSSVGSLRVRDLATLSGLSLEEVASVALAARPTAGRQRDRNGAGSENDREHGRVGDGIVRALEAFRQSHAGVRVSLGHGSILGAIRVRYCRAPRGTATLSRRSLRLEGTDGNAEDLGGGLFRFETTRSLDGKARTLVALSSRTERGTTGAILLFDRRRGRPWTPQELDAIVQMKAVVLFAEVLGASRASARRPEA